ncbi:MAG TPA: hypothetical protein PK760_14905 [Flavobacteriales bacterium]|nr:hypothetical protein [Flavobacteriales bacterium]
MKKTLLSVVLLGLCSVASAQLSTRENQDTRYKFGGRPVAGDMALVFGATINNPSFGDSADDTRSISVWNRMAQGNLITAKYYKTNDVAYRGGIRLYRNSRAYKGDLDSTAQVPNSLASVEYRNTSREYMLVPGIEKHFSSSNIFDVYVAGDLYLGFGRDKSVNSTTDRQGHTNSTTMTTPYKIVGLGGVIGFNVFVLDLPVSLGVEYGMSAFWQLGDKTHVEKEDASGSYDYYTVGNDQFQNSGYSSVKQKYMTMNTNNQVRIVANIYFN